MLTPRPQENWTSHMNDGEEGPILVSVDLGLAAIAPDKSRPEVTLLRVTLSNPEPNGFGSEAERKAVGDAFDALMEKAAKSGVLLAGTVRMQGTIDHWMFGPEGSTATVRQAAKAHMGRHEHEVGGGDDGEWAQYQMLLPPDGQPSPLASDAQVLSVLQQAGDRHELRRPVLHAALFPDAKSAAEFAEATEKAGFRVMGVMPPDDEGGAHLVEIEREHNVQLETILKVREKLTGLAERFGGEYDGWSCPVTKG